MASKTPQFWQRRSGRALLLFPLSLVFGVLTRLRRLCFRRGLCATHTAPVPVVVVGNIAVGGSGKTPVVDWLVRALKSHGWTPGIVSRGYGREDANIRILTPTDTAREVGDEPLLLAALCQVPVVVGADRPAAIRALKAAHPELDVVVSDDGMQHLAMARDAQVVVLDEQVLGNRWLLPAGPLREPMSRLAEATVLVIHGPASAALKAALPEVPIVSMHLEGDVFERIDDRSQRCRAGHFDGRRVHAVAGIGRPERFFEQLRGMGLDVIPHVFADHHDYCPEDLRFATDAPILLTEKDAVKCAAFAPADTWVFPVRARLPEAALQPILDSLERHGRQAD